MKKLSIFYKYFYILLFSIFSLMVFAIDYVPFDPRYLASKSEMVNFFTEFRNSIEGYDTSYIALWLFIFIFYKNVYFDGTKYNKKSIFCSICAFLFMILSIVANSYSIDNTLNALYSSNVQILKTFIFSVGYYLIYYAMLKKLVNIKFNNIKVKKKFFFEQLNDHTFRTSLIMLFIMWVPMFVISFPGLATGDTTDQLGQFFHTDDCWTTDSINLLNEDVYINKHHSVFHTLILGSIFKIGKSLGSFTIGAGIFNSLQFIFVLVVFALVFRYMCKIRVNSLIILFSILFIGLNPVVVTYVICAIKDTPSAIFNMLYALFMLDIVRDFDNVYKSKIKILLFLVSILMTLLLRNNGIYTVLLSFPFLFLVYKKNRVHIKKLMFTLMVPLFIFGLYDRVLLPSFDISDGSPREALSIPSLQIARVIRDHEDVFTDKDKENINRLFDFDIMKTFYDPDISDRVKETYNKDANSDDVKAFFGVWFKYLKKYPSIYIESVVNSTYGYFMPGKNVDKIFLSSGWDMRKGAYFDVKSLPIFSSTRTFINQLFYVYYALPIFINSVAYFDLFLLFSGIYIIAKKKYKYLVPLMPLYAVLLSCLASPLNGSFRYILPIIFSVPLIVSIDYLVYRESRNALVVE